MEYLNFHQIVKCAVGRDTEGVFIGCDFIAGFSENIFQIPCKNIILKARSDRAAASASALTLSKEYITFYLFHSHQVSAAAASLAMTLGIGLGPIFKHHH